MFTPALFLIEPEAEQPQSLAEERRSQMRSAAQHSDAPVRLHCASELRRSARWVGEEDTKGQVVKDFCTKNPEDRSTESSRST